MLVDLSWPRATLGHFDFFVITQTVHTLLFGVVNSCSGLPSFNRALSQDYEK
jgi:hypothetical protein